MPTENRSSNTEMASDLLPCPFCGEKPEITKHHREDIYGFMHRCPVLGPISWGFREDPQAHFEKWNARVQPAQHQGEPVALPGRKSYEESFSVHGQGQIMGWNACLDEIAKLGPLYTHPAPADPGEVERLRAEIERMRERVTPTHKSLIGKHAEIIKERDTLRAQLAEAHAQLRDALDNGELGRDDVYEAIHDYLEGHEDLPASAEPAKPVLVECDACPRSGGCANTCMKAPANAEQRAPVERDERAAFEVAPVLGFPSYSVSSDGIVYRNDSGNAIAQQANSKGYLTVNLSESGKATRRTVHRVVLESFVGVRPEGLQALHGDGNPANNRLSNLQWGESSENEADKALHGTKAIGSRNGASRLTEAMVQEILEAKRVGGKKWGAGLLAKKFGVDISTITRAARGKHWSEARAALERKP